MKVRRYLLLFLVLMIAALFSVVFTVDAQQQPKTCPMIVSDALTALGTNCANVSRNTSCLGHQDVAHTAFAQTEPPDFYTQPGDRSDLTITQAIQPKRFDLATEGWGLNVMNVNANVPTSISPKGVIYIQFGGMEVENGVEPTDAVQLVTGISVTSTSQTDLLTWPSPSIPGHASQTILSIPSGSTLSVDAVDPTNNFARVVFNDRTGWVLRSALDSSVTLSGVPTIGPDNLTPMQRFYYRTGIGGTPCAQAPSLLLVQGPNNVPVDLRVFDQPVRVESTIILRSLPPGDQLGNELQIIVLSGLAVIYPDTPNQIFVPPGFETHIGLADQFASLGIEGDADEKAPVGTWSQPTALTADDLNICGVTEGLPSNILQYTLSCPIVLPASGTGGTIPQIVFPNQQALDEAKAACQAGELPPDICQYLGI